MIIFTANEETAPVMQEDGTQEGDGVLVGQ